MKAYKRWSCTGFTLFELLVVIVIIAALAALSVMGFARMRAAGDRATTIAVMRQLQIANMSYAVEHNGQYAPIVAKDAGGALSGEWWRDAEFRSYITGDPTEKDKPAGQLIVAPLSLLDPIVVRSKKRQYDRFSASYGFNTTGLTYPTDDMSGIYSYKVHQVANPSRTAFMSTATDYTINYGSRFLWRNNPIEGKTTDSKMAYRHGNKAVIVYYDGSTGFVSYDDIARIDAQGGASNPFWKAKQ